MRRTVRLRAYFLVFLAAFAFANPAFAKKKKKKVKKAEPAAVMKPFDDTPAKPDPDAPKKDAPVKEDAAVVEVEVPDDTPDAESPSSALPTPEVIARTGFGAHRYAYIGSAVVLAMGFAFAYYAQGEATRAKTVGSAQETRNALSNAAGASSAANIMYASAATLAAYALLIEVLPQKYADKFTFTFHF
ncbi:MAG: hypothetical protein QM723_37805 [Myxococcaceae bacterium]